MKPAHEADAVVGLLLVSADGARLDEWRHGKTVEIQRFEFGEPMRDHHELLGPTVADVVRVPSAQVTAPTSVVSRESQRGELTT